MKFSGSRAKKFFADINRRILDLQKVLSLLKRESVGKVRRETREIFDCWEGLAEVLWHLWERSPHQVRRHLAVRIIFSLEGVFGKGRGVGRHKGRERGKHRLRQDWAGALEHLRDRYTSLDLQREILEWRGD